MKLDIQLFDGGSEELIEKIGKTISIELEDHGIGDLDFGDTKIKHIDMQYTIQDDIVCVQYQHDIEYLVSKTSGYFEREHNNECVTHNIDVTLQSMEYLTKKDSGGIERCHPVLKYLVELQ